VECLLNTETSARVIWFDTEMLLKMGNRVSKRCQLKSVGKCNLSMS
jgi:hypothetical protein